MACSEVGIQNRYTRRCTVFADSDARFTISRYQDTDVKKRRFVIRIPLSAATIVKPFKKRNLENFNS